ncbi:CobB/CobQ-like glutamine amidotransferase domain-containing protein, partial [Helicosporidium sp. ATCC 50920]
AQERRALEEAAEPSWAVPYAFGWTDSALLASAPSNPAAQVAVLREEGTNGDREMSSALLAAGLQPWDVTMSDLLSGRVTLDQFRGIVFPGGFSYADVLDSAKGWAAAIRFNAHVKRQFADWYARDDTWSLGVCNGCQLMALLGWVPGADVAEEDAGASSLFLPDASQPRFVHNASGRFECRWATVGVEPDSPAVLLRGMGGARLGVWVAHGEGRAVFPDEDVERAILDRGLAPMRYVDASGSPTEAYPANPNGSPHGVAALCSPNGRHLAMMPHPERCYLMWQNPWWPADVGLSKRDPGPWLKLFQNAREWVLQQQ